MEFLEDWGCGGPRGVAEVDVLEGDGAGGGEADVACVFVGGAVRKVGEAEESSGGCAGGANLRDERCDCVNVGDAEEEHGEDHEDGLGGECSRGCKHGAVVEDESCDPDDARVGKPKEEARVKGALETAS